MMMMMMMMMTLSDKDSLWSSQLPRLCLSWLSLPPPPPPPHLCLVLPFTVRTAEQTSPWLHGEVGLTLSLWLLIALYSVL